MSKISSGFIWSGIERFSSRGISFLLGIVIARLVSPSAYGLIVMIQVFLSFSQLFIDSGFSNALIQKKNREEIDYYTVFIFNLATAFSIYAILFITAPFIADFYDEPLLTPITRVISLNLLISSLSIVQKTRLTIILDFRTQTKAGVISVIISGVIGIICAYSGLEVWALVIQGIVGQIIISALLIYFSHWMPKFRFSKASFVTLFGYGSKLLMNNVLTNVYLNIYNLLIGKKYSSADLAFYNRGYNLSLFPSVTIADILDRVIFPIITKLQDDYDKMIAAYYKYLRLSNYIILPIMAMLIVLANPLVSIVLTPKWLPIVPYLRIFSITYMFHAWILQSTNIIAAVGNTGILLKYQILKRSISFILLLCTIGISIEAICWGVMFNSVIEYSINLYLDKKVLGVNPIEQIKSQYNIIIIVVIMSIAVYFFKSLSDNTYIQLFGGGSIGLLVYTILTFIFNLEEKYIFKPVLNFVTVFKQ